MNLSIFPDLNLWLALTYPGHLHHEVAEQWFLSLEKSTRFVFCRHTQMGLFRLMTTEAVMGADVRTQQQCWQLYEQWIGAGKAILAMEPTALDAAFRVRTWSDRPSPKIWADAYLAAFAEIAGLRLVTFDRALAVRVPHSILLGA